MSVLGTVWLVSSDGVSQLQAVLEIARQNTQVMRSNPAWWLVYAVACFVSQLLVLPSGSVLLIIAGFVFQPLAAAAVFALAQVLTAIPVYKLGQWIAKHAPQRLARLQLTWRARSRWQDALQSESVLATFVLRLTPVFPSAIASILAASLRIPLSTFVFATALVCWIRPLFFASLGASMRSMTDINELSDLQRLDRGLPLILLFVAVLLLLLARLYLRSQQRRA